MTGSYALTNSMIDDFNAIVQAYESGLNDTPVTEEVAPTEVTPEVPPSEPKEQAPTLETLENLSEKSDDSIPLKKFMSEKNARREAEARAKELEAELERMRNTPQTKGEISADISALSEKHNIDEEVLRDIFEASYKLSKDKIKKELEDEINPKLAELDTIKKEKATKTFEDTFNSHLEIALSEMPEYANLIDKQDLKDWIRSGRYSKLTLPQLIEEKYSKYVVGKKTTETYTPAKEVYVSKSAELSDDEWSQIDSNPQVKEKWKNGLEDRLRKFL